jgi:hypothetical protein
MLGCVVWGACASAQIKRVSRIGYAFPAGGRQGTSFEVIIGGQLLRGARKVHVTGDGVMASVVEYFKPFRNLMRDQRQLLAYQLITAKDKRVAALRAVGEKPQVFFPGERGIRAQALIYGKDAAGKTVAKIPPHPMLRDIGKKDLRDLIHIADSFLNFRELKKKQTNAQIAEMVMLRVRIAPGATTGDRELRLQTNIGLTNPICFQVGALKELGEREPNDPGGFAGVPREAAVDVPVRFNGQIMPGDVDRFAIRARRGQHLVIRAEARRLIPFLADAVPGWFQATIALYDSRGKEVAFADDHVFDPDPVISYVVPADGEYEIEIRDAIYRGREDFVYRVSVGELPFITRMFPLGGRAAGSTVAKVEGWNLPRKELELDTYRGARRVLSAAMRKGRLRSNEVQYTIDTLPERTEREPNDKSGDGPQKRETVEMPCIINGRIGSPGDVDSFRFEGRKGEEFVAEVQARRLRSPLDSLLRLTDESGKVVAWNDDNVQKEGHLHRDMGVLTHHADSYLRATLPADGTYCIRITDAQAHGGKAYAYRLRAGPPRPDFTLLATPPSLSVMGGRAVPLTVHILRRDGFEGAVDLFLAGDDEDDFVLTGARIPPGCNRVTMTLTAPLDAGEAPVGLRLLGRARVGKATITRRAIPSEDVMQAFLWRHLAPSRELVMSVKKMKWAPPSARRVGETPLLIPARGEVEVRYEVARRDDRRIDVALVDGPAGVTVRDVRNVEGGVTFTLKAEGAKAKPGAAGNLVVEAFVEAPPRAGPDGRKSKKPNRYSVGVLPAVPYVVVGGR